MSCRKSVYKTPPGRSALRGSASLGAAGSSACFRVRLCYYGGRIRWEDYEIKPGAKEWRRRHPHAQWSYKSLPLTVALVGLLVVVFVFVVLLEVLEPR